MGRAPVTEWIWDDRETRPAAAQMAIDLAMVDAAREEGVAIVRLYRWERDTVSFGAHEPAMRRWDRARLEADGVATVRRPTGGRAVWHDHEDLTYAWAGPVSGPGDVRTIYRALHERLRDAVALASHTLTLATAERTIGLGPGACFDAAAGGEVLVDGRKAIGSAQRVLGRHLLQHGAIAVADRGPRLVRYRLVPGKASSGAGPLLPDADEVRSRIAAHWTLGGAVPIPTVLTSRIVLASVGEQERHADPEWTWRR